MRGEETFQSVRRSPANSELQSAPISRAPVRRPRSEIVIDASRDRAIDRDLAKIEIAPSIAILISRDRDRRRDLAKRRTRSRRREIAPLIAISPSRDRARSRSRSMAREEDLRSRDLVCRQERKIRDRKISYVGKRGRSEIAIDASRDRAVDRDLAKKARLRSRRRSLSRIGFVVVGLDFSSLMIFF